MSLVLQIFEGGCCVQDPSDVPNTDCTLLNRLFIWIAMRK